MSAPALWVTNPMRRRSAFIGALILFSASLAASTFASADDPPDVCGVVQAAFMVATKSQDIVYPKDIRAASHPSTSSAYHFEKLTDALVAKWGLREGELSDLASQEGKYVANHFLPRCTWRGSPKSIMDENEPMWLEFSNPAFSSDSRLAIVDVSFFDSVGIWGYGVECVLRKAADNWAGQCFMGWIR